MEKKTIGNFIAALRKANGMTQRDLAERLNVSDKTVSRWERDDGAPDLSLIPVIAEIFDISCDELLRGERKSPAERSEPTENKQSNAKTEKQRQRLLKSTFSYFKDMTYISVGVSTVGMIAAMICNLAFLKALLGFLIGMIFFALGILIQIIFTNKTFFKVDDSEIEEETISSFKRKVISHSEKSIAVTVFFIGFTFPLAFVDAFYGLGLDSVLIYGTIGVVIFLAIYAAALYFINASLIKKQVYTLSEKEMAVYTHNHNLQKKCALILVLLLLFTFIFQAIASSVIWSADKLAANEAIIFEDFESFVKYMELDVPYDENGQENIEYIEGNDDDDDYATYYDENGNEISEEEALGETLEDKDGNVICSYIRRNENVLSIQYGSEENGYLPIRVITSEQYKDKAKTSSSIGYIYCSLYPLELLAVTFVYFKKRAK